MLALSTLATAGPWHVLAFSALFGTQFYQTFIGGVIAFKALPRPMFSQLQQRIFPVYFTLQSVFPVVLLTTHPSASAVSLLSTSSPYFCNTTVPVLLTLSMSAINLVFIMPTTAKIARERKAQETKEGNDEGPKSDAMKRLNSRFGRFHGISSLLNLMGFLATASYGVVLGSSLNL